MCGYQSSILFSLKKKKNGETTKKLTQDRRWLFWLSGIQASCRTKKQVRMIMTGKEEDSGSEHGVLEEAWKRP